MLELTPENVLDYLYESGRLQRSCTADVEWLAWGVSNVVLRIHPAEGDDFVVKQSRTQLRTEAAWFSRLDRIWREAELMQTLSHLLPAGGVPQVLFEDRDNYLFAMQAVDANHTVWKAELLDGKTELKIAATAGEYLASIHCGTYADAALEEKFGDREVFDQLRVDPFYRRVAQAHADLAPPIKNMIDEMFATAVCVVLADFSPKNMLITGGRLTLVDFETGHFGDPAFDLGFFLSHVLLKTVLFRTRADDFLNLARTFWNAYTGGMKQTTGENDFSIHELERRTVPHLAGCMLSRIDGKSLVDYLPLPEQQELVRTFCRHLFLESPSTLDDVFNGLQGELASANW